jgi:hypothetical protein
MIAAAANEPVEPGIQPQKYAKFDSPLLLCASAKALKRRARRDRAANADSTINAISADGTTNENSNQTAETMDNESHSHRSGAR